MLLLFNKFHAAGLFTHRASSTLNEMLLSQSKQGKQTARRQINRYWRGSSRLWQDWETEKSNVAWTAIFSTVTRWSVASLILIFLGTLPSSRLWSEKLQQGKRKQCCCLILQTVSILQFTYYLLIYFYFFTCLKPVTHYPLIISKYAFHPIL